MAVAHLPSHTPFVLPHDMAGLPPDTTVAVALSGGADSVALLHLLKVQGCTCHAIHVHHGIRGDEADRDADFCRALCERWQIPFTLLHIDVPALAREKRESLETVAREARYEVMTACMQRQGLSLLATAHHADDQLETMLQHLLRGSGLRGLCGIPALRSLSHGVLVRPLLPFSKDEILTYCRENELEFVTDSTNGEDCCTRNKLRLSVLPLLHELQPAASRLAARCAATLAEDEAFLETLAADFLKNRRALPTAELATLPMPLFARVMGQWLPVVPERVHLLSLRALCEAPAKHKALHLPSGTVVSVEGECLTLSEDESDPVPFHLPLEMGVNRLTAPRVCIVLRTEDEPDVEITEAYRHTAVLRFPAAAIKGSLFARPRMAGDKILHGGMHKTVRRLASLASLSPSLRARLPLICDEAGVLAIPFSLCRDARNIKKDNKNITCSVYFD